MTHIKTYFSNLLKSQGSKTGTTFLSFEEPLKLICLAMPLETVVEFGPGYSTKILIEYSKASIFSFETDTKWIGKYRDKYDRSRVKIIYKEPGWNLEEIRQYGEAFSMFFIDGGDRISALRTANHLLEAKGFAHLHDAHREVYEPGLKLFPHRYFPERHSCLLTKDEEVINSLKAATPPDYSCACQYCSSDARRAYFNQFVDVGMV